MSDEITRVEDDSPFRCQAMAGKNGQCRNRQVPGSEFCLAHGGRNARDKIKNDQKRLYLLEKFQDQVYHHADHADLKTLNNEVAILRMLLQTTINRCNDDHDLMLKSSSIVNMLDKLEKLVRSCDRLEQTSNALLDATQAIKWMNDIVEIIDRHVSDPEVVRLIVHDIMESYEETRADGRDPE